jgi:putative SOS response-associated peptidase YedK
MCGRYTIRTSLQKIIEAMSPVLVRIDPHLFVPRYNVAPTQDVPVIRLVPEGRELAALHWGLIPPWAKDPAIGNRMINARSETAAQKPAFRDAFKKRRCLLVADGFYEWKKTPDGKQPYFIHLRDDSAFALAGVWERWSHDQQRIESCTLFTTEPNELMRPIHDRMPAIIGREDYQRWLDPKTDPDDAGKLLKPFDAEKMEARPVSRRVNSPKTDDSQCVEGITDGDEQSLF